MLFSQSHLNICQFPTNNFSATTYPSTNLKATENLKLENLIKVKEHVEVEVLKWKTLCLRKHHKTKRKQNNSWRNDASFWNNLHKATSKVIFLCNIFKNFVKPRGMKYMKWFLMMIMNGFEKWMTNKIELSLITSWHNFQRFLPISEATTRGVL